MKGLNIYKTKDNFCVAEVHYSADPEKDPERDGQDWFNNALKGIPGGKISAMWRKEMEIDFTAYSGQLLCYDIIQNYRNKIIKNEYPLEIHNKYGSLDWGRNNPSSFHVYSVNEKNKISSIYEIYLNNISIPELSKLIKECPYYQSLNWITGDISLWSDNQEDEDEVRSLADKFKNNGITLKKSFSKSDDLAIEELLSRWNNLDEQDAGFIISPKCQKQVWEFERLRYKELSTAMLDRLNPHEQLVDKDNHSWDDFKYFINTLFRPADISIKETINPASPWGQYVLKQRQKGQMIYG